jgi:DNA-binding SARP family transcriptional activator
MLWVRTLGGLTLALDENPVTGVLTQRRRLALLALLAVARERGLSRDKLMAYLWPEADAAQARHALSQLLYAQRREFVPDQLFLGRKTVRLNAAVARSDVAAFEEALDRGDPAEAVSWYGGPFLDGFFLRGSREFERWVDGERARLARRMCGACIRLARTAAAAGDAEAAAEWWRRATDVDPLDSQLALDVVQALAAIGNRAGALDFAEQHRRRLESELGITADGSLLALMQQLRSADPQAG